MRAHITTIARAFAIALLAATPAGAAVLISTPAQAWPVEWSVSNKTKQSIYFDMYAQQGSVTSQIVYAKEAPLKPGETGKGTLANPSDWYNLYVWGRYCFAGQTYNLKRDTWGSNFELWTSAKDPAVLVMRVPNRGSNEYPMIKTGPCAW